jgi:hypothetical protein
MSDEAAKPDEPTKPARKSAPDAEKIEAGIVAQLAREVVETVGADAILVVWTKQRRRKTSVSMTSIGNALTVAGLMRWIADKVEEEEDEDEAEAEDEAED